MNPHHKHSIFPPEYLWVFCHFLKPYNASLIGLFFVEGQPLGGFCCLVAEAQLFRFVPKCQNVFGGQRPLEKIEKNAF